MQDLKVESEWAKVLEKPVSDAIKSCEMKWEPGYVGEIPVACYAKLPLTIWGY